MRRSVLFRSGSWFFSAALAALLAGAVCASPAAAATLNVACAGTCSASLIQDAINAAPSGAGILVGTGKYQGDITINKNVTLVSVGAVTIDGGHSAGNPGTVVSALSQAVATIDGFTITGGYANTGVQWGGGIYNNGTLTVRNSIITGNNGAGNEGGGIYNNGHLTVTGTIITGNTSNYGGGIGNYGALVMDNVEVSNNSAVYNGGGLDNSFGSGATISHSLFNGNESERQFGGGIDNYETTLTVQSSQIVLNSAATGGGIYSYPGTTPAGTVSLSNDTLVRNAPDNCAGGASC
jgi:hypothetical protein